MSDRDIDELLEAVYTCEEKGQGGLEEVLNATHGSASREGVRRAVEQGLIRQEGDRIAMTDAGRRMAENQMRRHRLAERLLVDALGLPLSQVEALACTAEHLVMPEVADGICTLLGHPRECPHGRPIPPGECCREGRKEAGRALYPLAEAPLERELRVAYLRTRDHDRLHVLLSLGLVPGTRLRLHQKHPAVVVEAGEAEFALDQEVAADIVAWLE